MSWNCYGRNHANFSTDICTVMPFKIFFKWTPNKKALCFPANIHVYAKTHRYFRKMCSRLAAHDVQLTDWQNGHDHGTHFSEKLCKLHKISTVPGKDHAITGCCYLTFVNGVVLLRSRWERINYLLKGDFYYLNLDWKFIYSKWIK